MFQGLCSNHVLNITLILVSSVSWFSGKLLINLINYFQNMKLFNYLPLCLGGHFFCNAILSLQVEAQNVSGKASNVK